MAKKFLAFDFGAESGRAILGTLDGGKLTLEEKHRFPNPTGQMNGTLHWDLLGQWEQIKQGLKNAKGLQLDGIGVDTWGVDYCLLDGDGNILGFPVMYRDQRTAGMMEECFKIVPRAEVFKQTGIQFMQINTLYHVLAMVKRKSAQLAAAKKMLFMPDVFNYLLTGVQKSEFSIATTSQMYDPTRRAWATPMLEKLGFPTAILPEIVPSGTVLGSLTEAVAKECGIPSAPVIAPGCHDTASAVASVPASGGNWCYISSGTWSLMGVELDQPLINDKTLQYNYTNEGGVGGKIRFLKNIMGMWLIQECRRQFIRDGHEHSYAELTKMAADSEPFAILVDPDDAPFGLPGDFPNKIDKYCRKTGQKTPSSRGAYIRACVDSLALKYRQTLEGLEDILGKKIDTIHIVGGGGQNELLNQLTADVCGKTVISGPVEATAIGNILAQAIGVGAVKSIDEARKIVRDSFPVKTFTPRADSNIASHYRRYMDLVNA